MTNFLRTLAAGLLLAFWVKPPAVWRMRPAGHYWWLLLPTIALSIARDRLAQTDTVAFFADGLQSDALGALLVLAAAALIGAWSGQRVLTWSLAVLASATGLWISAFTLMVRWGLAEAKALDAQAEFGLTIAVCVWWLIALQRLLAALLPQWRWWQRIGGALATAILTVAPFFLIDPARYWYPDYSGADAEYSDDDAEDAPSRKIAGSAEELIYRQPALVDRAVRHLARGKPGVTDAFLLAFGGDGNEDVFRNEVDYAQTLFASRFGMERRTLTLLNHPDTTASTPLATLSNLKLALKGMAARMDDEDLLVLFLTSHGSKDHELYVDMQPLPLDWIEPTDLRATLDASGIDWRVVIVSACYSGGFIDALQNPMSLIITAAREDRPSFGCGDDSEITYFGRAFLVDALNQTRSFAAAFELAKERVAEREKAEDFDASDPQIAMGALIGQRLQAWSDALAPADAVAFVPTIPKTACEKDDEPCP